MQSSDTRSAASVMPGPEPTPIEGQALLSEYEHDKDSLQTILYLYYTIQYYTILYYTILYYTILYYTVQYCTILYCTILYYTMLKALLRERLEHHT